MRRRVVVTGIGAITPLGLNVADTWASLQAGRSGVGRISLFEASTFPTKIAGEVKQFDRTKFGMTADHWQYAGRHIHFAVAAAREAVADSRLHEGSYDPDRAGVYLGSGEGMMDFFNFTSLIHSTFDAQKDEIDTEDFIRRGRELLSGQREFEQEPGRSASHLAEVFRAHGPNMNCLTACAASSQAIGEATDIIRRGDADVMISGGTHSMIHPFGVTGFNLLTALSTNNADPTRASRPFDKNRDGFVIGEGAGIVILEELERAKARGAKIYGEIKGYGTTADAFRMTDTHPEGRGAIACLKEALADAELQPGDIHYINAHGTSTEVNDRVETIAIKEVFGAGAKSIPVSSIKSMTGHLIAAAGCVEAITCLLAIRDGVLPPTINYETPDPECDLDYVPNVVRKASVEHAVSNSFGFGGQNISLVVSGYSA
jgi:3-oxoacyl-[acyl-carrier-protein] synthase II